MPLKMVKVNNTFLPLNPKFANVQTLEELEQELKYILPEVKWAQSKDKTYVGEFASWKIRVFSWEPKTGLGIPKFAGTANKADTTELLLTGELALHIFKCAHMACST